MNILSKQNAYYINIYLLLLLDYKNFANNE